MFLEKAASIASKLEFKEEVSKDPNQMQIGELGKLRVNFMPSLPPNLSEIILQHYKVKRPFFIINPTFEANQAKKEEFEKQIDREEPESLLSDKNQRYLNYMHINHRHSSLSEDAIDVIEGDFEMMIWPSFKFHLE